MRNGTKLRVAKYDLDNFYQKVNQNDVVRALNLSLALREGPVARRNFVAVKKLGFDFNCRKPKEILTHTIAPTKGPWLRTSGKDNVEHVYLTTSKNVRQGYYVIPLGTFHTIIDCDFRRGYTAIGTELFRTCKGLATGSPLSVYLAVLCVFFALYNMHNNVRSTIHVMGDCVGEGSTFKYGLLVGVDR